MAGRRKAIELAMSEEDLAALRAIARSRSEPASRVERARMLLAYWDEPSFFKVGRAVGAHHQTVQRCVERALVYGPMAALDDRPRPGKEPTITAEAKAWVVDLACRKAKELGYPHELWTTRLLARHAREHGPAEGHACLAKLAQGTLCKIGWPPSRAEPARASAPPAPPDRPRPNIRVTSRHLIHARGPCHGSGCRRRPIRSARHSACFVAI